LTPAHRQVHLTLLVPSLGIVGRGPTGTLGVCAGQKQTGYTVSGIAWYRKNFTVDPEDKGNRIFLRFDGVYMNSGMGTAVLRSEGKGGAEGTRGPVGCGMAGLV
jgi:hypothetical protein